MFHSHRHMYLGPYLGPRSSKFHFGPQKSTKNYMGYGYIPCEFLMLGPQIGPQIIIFENYITSSLTGTKNQFHILNGWDLRLCYCKFSCLKIRYFRCFRAIPRAPNSMCPSVFEIFLLGHFKFDSFEFYWSYWVDFWFHMILSFPSFRFLSGN